MASANAPRNGADEEQVEQVLRSIVGPLNRRLTRIYMLIGALAVIGLPLTVALLGQVWSWWTAALAGVGGAFLVVATFGLALETWASRRAAREFNGHFPVGGARRALAVKILAQLRTRTKAEDRLQAALTALSPEEWVFRVKPVDPDLDLEAGLAALGEMSLPPATPAEPSAVKDRESPVRRSGGAYGYIPLEPRDGREPAPGPAPAEEPSAHIPLDPRSPPAQGEQSSSP
jgi:hypothetical protein